MSTDLAAMIGERRRAKALALADTLRRIDPRITADVVARMDDQARRDTETIAGVERRGSDTTWRLVASMIAGSARTAAACPTCRHGNPAGPTGRARPYTHRGDCVR
jgi:hypothetical protein